MPSFIEEKTEQFSDIGTTCKSITYKKAVGCKNLYITIVYKDDDKIDYFLLDGRGDNECGKAFLQTLADMLTFSVKRIRNEYEAEAIIKNFKFHRCNKYVVGKAKSCSDAIGEVLEKILIKKNEQKAL